jgi:HSP20 family protein
MVARWDPVADLFSLREMTNRLIGDGFGRQIATPAASAAITSYPLDMFESTDEVFVRAAVPGLNPDEIELTVNQNVLTVKGSRSFYNGEQEKQYRWHIRGLSEGNLQFSVALPAAVDANAAEAACEAGVLTIRLPKAESVKTKRIMISGGQKVEAVTGGSR